MFSNSNDDKKKKNEEDEGGRKEEEKQEEKNKEKKKEGEEDLIFAEHFTACSKLLLFNFHSKPKVKLKFFNTIKKVF